MRAVSGTLAPDGASAPCCQSCVSTRSSSPSWAASRIRRGPAPDRSGRPRTCSADGLRNQFPRVGKGVRLARKQTPSAARRIPPVLRRVLRHAHSACWSRVAPAVPMSRTCRIGSADCRRTRPHDRARPNTTPGRLSGGRRQRGQRPAIPTCRPADCGVPPREVCFAREKKTATVRSVNYRPHGSAIAPM